MNPILETLRYSCQMQLPGFGEAKQEMLRRAKVLIIGAGGLGCPAAQYLAAAGVGTITLADFDVVSISNLHRQILYTPGEAGLNKATVACGKLSVQNPQIILKAFTEKITTSNVLDIIGEHDVVLDGTDNFETRYLINDACVLSGKPLVYGAIYQYEGQVAIWNGENADGTRTPNYRDVFPEVNAALVPNCAEGGVIPTLAGIIGCMQANEAIKLITKTGEPLTGKLLLLDVQTMQSRIINTGMVSSVMIRELPSSVQVDLLTVEDLNGAIDLEKYEWIDVRTAKERSHFTIGGKHLPMNTFEEHLSQIDPGKPIICYCATGKRSAEAVKILKHHFPGVIAYSLDGGMKAWQEKQAMRMGLA